MHVDPFVILELPRGAPEAAVRQAFRRLALRYHPDRNPGDPEAEARFKLISAAYQRLKLTGFRAQGPAPAAAPRPGSKTTPPRSEAWAEAGHVEEPAWQPPPRPDFWPDGAKVHYPTAREIAQLVRSLERPSTLSSMRVWGDRLVLGLGYLVFGSVAAAVVAGAALVGYLGLMSARAWLGWG